MSTTSPASNSPRNASPAADTIRRTRFLLLAILLLSLAVRVVYVLQSRGNPSFDQPSMDALYHLEWARAIADGREYQPGPFFRAPLYPWFLGLLIRLFGENLLAVRLVQAAIGTASVGLVYLVGARAFDARTGLLAALFAGLYWVTIYFEGELLLPVLEIFFDLLAIWLALRVDEKPTPGRAALCGAAFGLAALVRPNVLLFCPFVLLWILLGKRSRPARSNSGVRGRARLAAAVAFVAALATPIVPVTAYNGLVGGDWVLVSSQGGVNFWIGNNPASDGQSAIVPGTRADWWGGYHDSIRMAEAEAGRKLLASEVSRHYAGKAWTWIRSEPQAALEHLLWKLRLFWIDWELSNNTSERFFALRYGPVLRLIPLGFGVLAPLALLGFCLAARDWRRLLPLWGFLPVYMASVVAFFVCSRFRVPLLPVMAILAAHACWRLVGMVRTRSIAALAGSAAFLAVAVVLVEWVPSTIDRSDRNGLWQLGQLAAQRGDDGAAVEHYRASIAIGPTRNAMLYVDLANALRRRGQPSEAEENLRRAVAVDAGNVVALSSLFDLLLATGRRDEARVLAREAVERSAVYAPARYDLGRVLYLDALELKKSGADPAGVQARLEQALAEFTRGEELSIQGTNAFRCAFVAARVLGELGRREEAVAAFERALTALPDPPGRSAVEDDAWWWQCQVELLAILDVLGRKEEALGRRAELQRRFPHDPRLSRLTPRSGH